MKRETKMTIQEIARKYNYKKIQTEQLEMVIEA